MTDTIRKFVVGTAGHIDHGKTALLERITEDDPDRLPEEKDRGMTIDLGFAEYTMPDGTEVGLIDVPGHEKFIRNMVAGAAAVDFVIFVVAADDGVMPQTREHLLISEVLGIERGIPVITKIDLVEDVLVEVVREEMEELFEGTFLEEAPICPVSSETGEGIDAFCEVFEAYVREAPDATPDGIFRMPVQRVFTVKGFGTVVTGVPVSGQVKTSDTLEVIPSEQQGRVRGIQVHHRDRETAQAGHRAALNLSEVHHEEVDRGDVISEPGYLSGTSKLEARFTYQLEDGDPLTHREPIRFLVGSREETGYLVPLEGPSIKPGENMLVQIRLDEPVVAVPGDRFVLRYQTPMYTLGGGRVVGLSNQKQTGSNTEQVRELKERVKCLDDRKALLTRIGQQSREPFSPSELARKCFMPEDKVRAYLEGEEASRAGFSRVPGTERYIHEDQLHTLKTSILRAVNAFHEDKPLKVGVKSYALESSLDEPTELIQVALEELREEGKLVHTDRGFIQKPDHEVTFSDDQAKTRQKVEDELREDLFSPPDRDRLKQKISAEKNEVEPILTYLEQKGIIVDAGEGILFHRQAIEEAKEKIRETCEGEGYIETGAFRDKLGTSRKYIIPLLEYLDDQNFTYRDGNRRYLV